MNEKKPGNPWTKSLLIWVAVLFGLVLFVQTFDSGSAAPGEPLAYSEFVQQVDEGNVQSVTIATSPVGNVTISGKLADGKAFRTIAPADANVSDRLIAKGVGVAGQGRGAVELLADPALPVAAVPADPRHQLLRHAPDAEECRRRRDGLRQEPRPDADREAGPGDLRRRRRHRRGPRGACRKSSNI